MNIHLFLVMMALGLAIGWLVGSALMRVAGI